MYGPIVALFTSLAITFFIIRYAPIYQNITGDTDFDGPQKFHTVVTPRIGGMGIFLGFFLAIYIADIPNKSPSFEKNLLLSCIPVFGIGLTEDLYKRVRVKTRLLATLIGAFLACTLLGVTITSLDILGIDFLLNFYLVSLCFTVFAITGLTNAYNIIDGFNGLSSMVAIITLLALSYVSFVLGDLLILDLCLILIFSIMAFFLFNFPKGLIFLGDGGAYFIGFSIALLSILLTNRNPAVSPWFALVINIYPITETVFSMYRRYKRKLNPGLPDGIHFHTLIYRRILKNTLSTRQNITPIFSANAKTSPYLWVLTSISAAPAVLFWNSTPALIIVSLLFVSSYVWVYYRIVCYRTPRWLKIY